MMLRSKRDATLWMATPWLLLALVWLPRESPAAAAACMSIQVSDAEAPAHSRSHRARRQRSFSASEVLDLQFEVFLASPPEADHRVELKLFTPKGHLYQKLPAVVGPASPGPTRAEGRTRQTGVASAKATLPVAGTTIVMSSLYGQWQVEAYVDGATTPCTRAQKFVIKP